MTERKDLDLNGSPVSEDEQSFCHHTRSVQSSKLPHHNSTTLYHSSSSLPQHSSHASIIHASTVRTFSHTLPSALPPPSVAIPIPTIPLFNTSMQPTTTIPQFHNHVLPPHSSSSLPIIHKPGHQMFWWVHTEGSGHGKRAFFCLSRTNPSTLRPVPEDATHRHQYRGMMLAYSNSFPEVCVTLRIHTFPQPQLFFLLWDKFVDVLSMDGFHNLRVLHGDRAWQKWIRAINYVKPPKEQETTAIHGQESSMPQQEKRQRTDDDGEKEERPSKRVCNNHHVDDTCVKNTEDDGPQSQQHTTSNLLDICDLEEEYIQKMKQKLITFLQSTKMSKDQIMRIMETIKKEFTTTTDNQTFAHHEHSTMSSWSLYCCKSLFLQWTNWCCFFFAIMDHLN